MASADAHLPFEGGTHAVEVALVEQFVATHCRLRLGIIPITADRQP
jgi:hypothetical protein